MQTFLWPTEDGWPYPDTHDELADLDGEADDDLLNLTAFPRHLLDGLTPMERLVITARFGLWDHPERTMRELIVDTGASRGELHETLEAALAKLRSHLRA